MTGASGPTRETLAFLVEGMPVLSGNARNFVRRHPRQARMAVAAALAAVAANRDVEDVPERLRPIVVRRGGEGTPGVSDAAALRRGIVPLAAALDALALRVQPGAADLRAFRAGDRGNAGIVARPVMRCNETGGALWNPHAKERA